MKPRACLYLLLLALAISACAPATSTPTPFQTRTDFPSPTVNPPTITPAPAPTATPTLTPPATLEPEQAKEALRTLLAEPVDCAAPCFWGILPGQTTFGEAKNIFAHFGLTLEYTNTLEGKQFYESSYEFDNGLSISPLLTVKNNIVVNLTLFITPNPQQIGIPRAWLAYSPETLITRYGEPSRVDFALDWGPRSFFDMVMRFDRVELIAEYTGYDIIPRQKGSSQVCPLTAQFESVRLWMGKDPVYPPADGILLEEATSLTMKEFSKLMTGDLSKACFTVNGEVFP